MIDFTGIEFEYRKSRKIAFSPDFHRNRNRILVQLTELVWILPGNRAERGTNSSVASLPCLALKPAVQPEPQHAALLTTVFCAIFRFSQPASLLSFTLSHYQKTKSTCPKSSIGNISLSSPLMMPLPTRYVVGSVSDTNSPKLSTGLLLYNVDSQEVLVVPAVIFVLSLVWMQLVKGQGDEELKKEQTERKINFEQAYQVSNSSARRVSNHTSAMLRMRL